MKKILLHVGSGPLGAEFTHVLFQGVDWEHVRVDANPDVEPDVVADMVTLAGVREHLANTRHHLGPECSQVDGIYSSHSFEHLHVDDAFQALHNWRAIFRPGGLLIMRLPDLESAAEAIVAGRPLAPLYVSPAGPISALDIIFGFRDFSRTNVFMRHAWGYTRETLERMLVEAGYSSVNVFRDMGAHEIHAFARKAA